MAPSWTDQRLQIMTRYLFTVLGIIYFNLVFEYTPSWLTLAEMNVFFVAYLGWITLVYLHARRKPYSPLRFRIAMWTDILGISLTVLNDPFIVPLTALVYIIIVLGNGMRYGMRCFSEALIGSFFAALITMTLRYAGSFSAMTPGGWFLNVFGGLILVYAYILMSRVDANRRNLEAISRSDPLTGLLNRGALMQAAETALEPLRSSEAETVVVMFADLDKFKAVNDTLGHAAGDRVLRAVARIIQQNMRSQDIAARYGGDEFVLLLHDTRIGDAEVVARRLQQNIDAWAQRNAVEVSVSIGLGEAPTHGTDLETLLHRVDEALYQSKLRHGTGGICHAACAA